MIRLIANNLITLAILTTIITFERSRLLLKRITDFLCQRNAQTPDIATTKENPL